MLFEVATGLWLLPEELIVLWFEQTIWIPEEIAGDG